MGVDLQILPTKSYHRVTSKQTMVNYSDWGEGGGGWAFDAIQELNPYYSRTIASTVFLLCDFSSNLPGNNLVLSGFGS